MPKGYVEHVDNWKITGWAYSSLEETIVDVYIYGHHAGEALANVYRSDLNEAGINHGYASFSFEVLPDYRNSFDISPLDVVCRIRGTDFILKRYQHPKTEFFLSSFGGLWIDRPDSLSVLEAKLRDNRVNEVQGKLLTKFMRDGYIILNNAVSIEHCDILNADIDKIWRTPPDKARVETFIDGKQIFDSPMMAYREGVTKLLDVYAYSRSAIDVISSSSISSVLELIFEEGPVAFQSLSFWNGSQQDIHKDTAYVKVLGNPLALAAAWIALEDVEEGTGELEFDMGSHRLPDYAFEGGKWMQPSDDHNSFLAALKEDAKREKLARVKFLPKKGDVLIWHADLAHGGSKITTSNRTRKSLVVHFCPESLSPYWRLNKKQTNFRKKYNGIFFESQLDEISSINNKL